MLLRQLSRDNRLLLVTTGHAPGDRIYALTTSDIVLLNQILRILFHLCVLDESVVLETRFKIVL